MAQVRIFGPRDALVPRRQAWSDCIHGCFVAAPGLPESMRFRCLVPMNSGDILYPEDRSERSSIIEISMFAGRTEATKRRLIRLLFERIETQLGVAPQDVEVRITESPAANRGIRGRCGDELALDYDVTI